MISEDGSLSTWLINRVARIGGSCAPPAPAVCAEGRKTVWAMGRRLQGEPPGSFPADICHLKRYVPSLLVHTTRPHDASLAAGIWCELIPFTAWEEKSSEAEMRGWPVEAALAGESRPPPILFQPQLGKTTLIWLHGFAGGGCTCSILGGKHQVQSEGPITPGSRAHQHSCLPPVGLDERHIEPQCPRVGLGWLTTSSLRVTGQACGAQPPTSVQKVRED